MSLTNIALFPIPDCVSFPGTSYPLHVFEPRYRAMVKHCIANNMYIGVCHTEKEVSAAKPNQTPEQAMHSNQATYKPYEVFSAGRCELIHEMDDGRMLVNINLIQRYKAVEEIQTLPFSVFACEEYLDEQVNVDPEELSALQDNINCRLASITRGQPRMQAWLNSPLWQSKSAEDFSFELFGMLHLDADTQQKVLEAKSPIVRLNIALEQLVDATKH